MTITVSCASTPCTVTITITIDPPSHGTRAVSAKKKKPKIVTIAKGTFKIKKKGNHKLTVKLTKAGKTLLKKDHGHLKPTVLLRPPTGAARGAGRAAPRRRGCAPLACDRACSCAP